MQKHFEVDISKLEDLITVIISTKNRWADLEKALLSLRTQSLTHKVIVMDDNSTDNTSSKIRELFPEVSLFSFKESKGYIVRRNEAVELATTPYILSIDDDCILETPTIIYEIASFCFKTECAAVAWPNIDINSSKELHSKSPAEGLWQTNTFKGCSFIVNKQSFLENGGFRTAFVHQGEEEDFCIRLLNAKYPVLLGKGNYISHYESPKRSFARMDFYGSRNLILFAFFNVPLVFLPFQLFVSSLKCILHGFKIKRPYQKTKGVIVGFIDGFKLVSRERNPVSIKAYLKYRGLKKKPQSVLPLQKEKFLNKYNSEFV